MTTFKVSKPGYNAQTDINPQHLYFNSAYNTFKLIGVMNSILIIAINDGGGPKGSSITLSSSITLPTLSYTPFFFVAINSDSGFIGYNYFKYLNSANGFANGWSYLDTSSNEIIANYTYSSGGGYTTSLSFDTYLFANPV